MRDDEAVSDIVEAVKKARELSAKTKEYFSAMDRLEGLVTKQRDLVNWYVYVQFGAEVPQDLYVLAVKDMRAYERFLRLIEILERGPSSMVKSEVELGSSGMVIRKEDRVWGGVFIELRKPDLCDIAMIAVVEKYGGVITRMLEDVQRRSEEVAEKYRRIAEIATVVDAMLR
jgi:hypothetical protein